MKRYIQSRRLNNGLERVSFATDWKKNGRGYYDDQWDYAGSMFGRDPGEIKFIYSFPGADDMGIEETDGSFWVILTGREGSRGEPVDSYEDMVAWLEEHRG
ncbi:hypothetical protein [uncultured Duncaniella sp.]|uniref:hypothetical protein n=1 Tax=uncultured Duncaniella sp. TaxID=2768039 RepID=UPI0026043832|nr:hypothetical protein [uncultured Duncaniella sp.]